MAGLMGEGYTVWNSDCLNMKFLRNQREKCDTIIRGEKKGSVVRLNESKTVYCLRARLEGIEK